MFLHFLNDQSGAQGLFVIYLFSILLLAAAADEGSATQRIFK